MMAIMRRRRRRRRTMLGSSAAHVAKFLILLRAVKMIAVIPIGRSFSAQTVECGVTLNAAKVLGKRLRSRLRRATVFVMTVILRRSLTKSDTPSLCPHTATKTVTRSAVESLRSCYHPRQLNIYGTIFPLPLRTSAAI
jgi:hypothetical protein